MEKARARPRGAGEDPVRGSLTESSQTESSLVGSAPSPSPTMAHFSCPHRPPTEDGGLGSGAQSALAGAPLAAWSVPYGSHVTMAVAVHHAPAKRQRVAAPTTTLPTDPCPRPLYTLELLTHQSDALLVLRSAALAGFDTPRLETADNAQVKQSLQRHNAGERPISRRLRLEILTTNSDSEQLSSGSNDERAAPPKPKRKRQRLAAPTQSRNTTTSSCEAFRLTRAEDSGSVTKGSPGVSAAVNATVAKHSQITAAVGTMDQRPVISFDMAVEKSASMIAEPARAATPAASGAATADDARSMQPDRGAAAAATTTSANRAWRRDVNQTSGRRGGPASRRSLRTAMSDPRKDGKKPSAAAAAMARKAAIKAATAGMTAHRARYIHTELTFTNILPEGRKRRQTP